MEKTETFRVQLLPCCLRQHRCSWSHGRLRNRIKWRTAPYSLQSRLTLKIAFCESDKENVEIFLNRRKNETKIYREPTLSACQEKEGCNKKLSMLLTISSCRCLKDDNTSFISYCAISFFISNIQGVSLIFLFKRWNFVCDQYFLLLDIQFFIYLDWVFESWKGSIMMVYDFYCCS